MLDRLLQARLDSICRRQRLLSLLKASTRGLMAAALAFVALRLVAWVTNLPTYVLWWMSGLVGLIIVARGWDRSQSRLKAAFLADGKLGLNERITAAVEFSSLDHHQSPLVDRLQQDASTYASAIDPQSLVPYRLSKDALLSFLLVLLAVLVHVVVPWGPAQQHGGLSAEHRLAIDEQANQLQSLADSLLQRAALQDRPDLAQMGALLQDLAERLQRGEISPNELADHLARIEDQMNAMLDDPPSLTASTPPPDAAAPRGMSEPTPPDSAPEAGAPPGDHEAATETGDDQGTGEDSESGGEEGSSREQPSPPGGSADADGEVESEAPAPQDGGLDPSATDDSTPSDASDNSEDTPDRQSGEGDAAGDAPPDGERPDVSGQEQQLSGIVDSSEASMRRLDSLSPATSQTQVSASTSAPDAVASQGDESSVSREDVPPQFRHWVRRYFEELAADD